MFQTLITRKNLIAISIAMFYSLVLLFTGLCLDSGGGFVVATNPIAKLAMSLGFTPVSAGVTGYICVILMAVYVIILVAALAYERRYAIVNGIRLFAPKMVLTYTATVIISVALSFGVGLLIQTSKDSDNIKTVLSYIGQSLTVSLILYSVLFLAVGAVIMFIVNFINVDKPYKFFDDNDAPSIQDEIEQNLDVTNSFDSTSEEEAKGNGNGGGYGGNGGNGGAGGHGGNGGVSADGVIGGDVIGGGAGGSGYGSGDVSIKENEFIADTQKVFPGLTRIDLEHNGFEVESVNGVKNITLAQLAEDFRNYLAKEEKLYFDIEVIRFFLSGFATSNFMILEGLSGTGKSSLPRSFVKYVNGRILFMPVQTTWRDKTNLIGFFNEFSKTYSETEFLEELYRTNYNPDRVTIFVLDEMNISRVEYYFADLLSVLEYPKEQWRLKVMQLPHDFVPPMKLDDGYIHIPENSFFVGTANKDDSTFTITDKVYDRAITIDFTASNTPFEVEAETPKITLGYSTLRKLYDDAIANPALQLTAEDQEKISKVLEYVVDRFDIAIGNRILNQINKIVPVFCACGGTKEEAIDFMLAKKLVYKVEGRFEEHIKDSLQGLIDLIYKLYGNGTMPRTVKTAKAIMKLL